uniref:Secreted protein n=1 Tax=Leishmania guyanensis TaxID=5670 RepID=A0A1E1IQF5_LEIGU|nr:Hypothetical protein BN36_1009940 [Leishmania guyanensis]
MHRVTLHTRSPLVGLFCFAPFLAAAPPLTACGCTSPLPSPLLSASVNGLLCSELQHFPFPLRLCLTSPTQKDEERDTAPVASLACPPPHTHTSLQLSPP